MKTKIHFFALLLILLQAFNLAQAESVRFILWAEGQGNNLKDAKASAVAALSQQVISKVESSFRSEVSDNVNRDMKSVKQIKSDMIMKGVQYVDEAKDGNSIRITAGMDRHAILSTLDFMKQQLDVDYSILDMDEKQQKLVISDQLTAFLSILPGSILQSAEGLNEWNKQKRDLLLKNIYMGRIEFVSNVPSYKITVDEKPVTSGSFFNAGSYEFEASADGYRTISGHFSARPQK